MCVFKVRAADGDPRGLLWVLDEEMLTPASSENIVLERVSQYYSNTGKTSLDVSVCVCVWRECVIEQCGNL